jgi:hypothetical protein
MHFLLFSFSCVPDISNFSDILFNLRLFVTVLHLDFNSVCEGVAVDDETAVGGFGTALLMGGCGIALLVDGCGTSLLLDGFGTALLKDPSSSGFGCMAVDGCVTALFLDGVGTAFHNNFLVSNILFISNLDCQDNFVLAHWFKSSPCLFAFSKSAYS